MRQRALILGLLASALLPLVARAQAITAAPGGEMTSLVGMPFDVPFYVDMTARSDKLGSFAARIQWDTTVLRFNGGSNGTFGSVAVNQDSLALGVVRIAGANPAGVGGLLTLGIAHFTPLRADTTTIRFAVTELFSAGTFADLTPSLTVHNASFCPARGVFGDIDKDGNINSRDALIALSNAVGLNVSAFDILLGDVDGNGATNARDALIILSYAVGMPVTGFRVDRLAGGSCASNLPLAMKITPDSLGLVVGQTVAFEARALNASGQLQTVTDAIWRSSNPAALGLFPDGKAVARDTGTVLVTAVRGALDSAQISVHIVGRRTRHIVDATAAGATNRLGMATLPFGSITEGLGFAHDGDTVEVRTGRYAEAVLLDRPVVLMGDTLSDGTRPVVALDSTHSDLGIAIAGGSGPREVHNIAVNGYYAAIGLEGASQVLLRGVRTSGGSYGVSVDVGPVGSLRVENSRLTGLGVSTCCGDGLTVNALVDTLVIQGTEISDYYYDGVYAPFVDSLAVRRSRIHDVGEYGIYAPVNGCCSGAPPAIGRSAVVAGSAFSLVVDSSALVQAGYGAVYANGAIRSAVISHSVISNSNNDGIRIYGGGNGRVRLVGDSIVSAYNWLYVENVDSLVMDSAAAHLPNYSYGYAYNVPLVRLTNSRFLDVEDRVLQVDFGGSISGGRAMVDNVTVVGNANCDGCAEAFNFYGAAATVNRLTAINLNDGIYASEDSGLTVTNSLFRHVYYPIDWNGTPAVASSRLSVSNTTFQGFSEAIYASGGAVVVDSNTFVNSNSDGVYVSNQAPTRITRNQITGVADPIHVYGYTSGASFADTISDNVIAGLPYDGIYADGNDTVAFRIVRNSLTCNQTGASSGYGVHLSYARGVIANNQVAGCYAGIEAYDDGSAAKVDSIASNVVTMPAGGYGIHVNGTVKALVLGNALTGDTTRSSSYGGIYVEGYTGTGATALVSQNTVTGGTTYGIYAYGLDTAVVDSNTVLNVAAPYYYSEGGIVFGGYLRYLARIYGNTVRHVTGNGIWTWNYNYNGIDTATVLVDSNLVAYSGGVGIQLEGGVDLVVHNRVTGSGIAGVQIYSPYYVDTARTQLHGNNIIGNVFGLQAYGYPYHAEMNWWGRGLGPKCAGAPCDTLSTAAGDSVSVGLLWIPPAPGALGGTPPLNAPAVASLVAPQASLLAAPTPAASAPLEKPMALRPRTVRATVAGPTRAVRTFTLQRTPAGMSAARATALQQQLVSRATNQASLAQRDAAQAAARAARDAARAARLEQLQQLRAQRDSARAATVAKQAAARAAREAQRP
jgi:hypothetical protein